MKVCSTFHSERLFGSTGQLKTTTRGTSPAPSNRPVTGSTAGMSRSRPSTAANNKPSSPHAEGRTTQGKKERRRNARHAGVPRERFVLICSSRQEATAATDETSAGVCRATKIWTQDQIDPTRKRAASNLRSLPAERRGKE